MLVERERTENVQRKETSMKFEEPKKWKHFDEI